MQTLVSTWILGFTLATALATSMLAVGTRIGRQRTVATLAQLLDRGTFRLLSSEGNPVSVQELSRALDADLGRPKVAPGYLVAVALAAAIIAGLLAFLVARSSH